MKRLTAKKIKWVCLDGPWKGKTLWLQHDGATSTFIVDGQKGRYIKGRWEPA